MDKAAIGIGVLLLMSLLPGRTHAALRVTEDYLHRSGQHWIKISPHRARYTEAFLTCRLEGRKLMSPGGDGPWSDAFTAAANRFPAGIWSDFRAPPRKEYWSPFHDQLISAFSSVFTWRRKLPRNRARCLVILPNLRVRDSNCDEDLPFFCSRWGEVWRPGTTECNTFDKQYKLASTGSCYKFHSVGLPWQQAAQACMSEGAHLAIINSYSEANVVKKLINQKGKIKTGYGYHTAFVGIYYYHVFGRGYWTTIEDQTLGSAGFTQMAWYSGEPETCGGFRTDGIYIPLSCARPYRFICEKNPKVPL